MNKGFLPLTFAAVLASPAVHAQNTTMYGIFDLGYQHASVDNVENKNFVQQGMRDGSRFGVKGSEDLEGGLSALYGFEFSMPVDTGSAPDLSRLAFVGLGSKAWGQLTLGRQETQLYHAFAVGSAHGYGTFTSSYGQVLFLPRASNSVKYSSPVFNGLSVGAIWSPSGTGTAEPTNATQKANYYDLAVRWTPAPFAVAAGYAKNKDETAGVGSTDTKVTELSANWDNKAFGIYGNYQKGKTDAPGATTADLDLWSVSGVARFGGRHELYALYARLKDKVAAGEPEATTYGLVYENVLSKRTRLYVGYGKTDNDDGLTAKPTGLAVTPTSGEAATGFQLGISHSF